MKPLDLSYRITLSLLAPFSLLALNTLITLAYVTSLEFPQWLSGKESIYNTRAKGHMGSIPGSGGSPGGGHGNPLPLPIRRTPSTEESGGLQSIGSKRVGHD